MERWTEAAADDMRALLHKIRGEGGGPQPTTIEVQGNDGSTTIRGYSIALCFTETEGFDDPLRTRLSRRFLLLEFIPDDDGVSWAEERRPKP